MSTIVRKHGTKVTQSANGLERIAAIRQIVDAGQYAKVDGIMVDLFSASAILQVYDAINDANKEKYRNLSVSKMANIAFKLINQGGK